MQVIKCINQNENTSQINILFSSGIALFCFMFRLHAGRYKRLNSIFKQNVLFTTNTSDTYVCKLLHCIL